MSPSTSIKSSRITSPNPEYATCDETYAKLLIYPDLYEVAKISRILQIKPTSIQKKGDELTNSRGRVRVVKNSLWALSSEGHIVSKDLRDHLNWIIEKLQGRKEDLRNLQNLDGLKMTISCVWWSAFGHSGPVLWPEQMKALAELNLECSFDVYFSDND